MLGLRPTTAERPRHVDAPRTAVDATASVDTVLAQVLRERLDGAHRTDPVFARDLAERVSAFVRQGGKRLRTAFAWCGW
ncbi:polyprenyl synthetase family protein, partial [Streptomyces sp. NPDC005904]